MDWSGHFGNFVPQPDTPVSLLYNCSLDPYSVMEVRHSAGIKETLQRMAPVTEMSYGNHEKKKRLTSDQIGSLERNFQEDVKLDPDRKMKLSRELGLQPRQIAVWFQNRRARWKAKQHERLYDSLKQEFDVITREKQKLQDEVLKLRAMLRDQSARKDVANCGTQVSAEETVESSSLAVRISKRPTEMNEHQIAECSYLFNVDEYNSASPSYWGSLPSCSE